MLESNDSSVRFRLTFSFINNPGRDSDGVADKDGIGKCRLIKAKVAQGRPKRGVTDRETNYESQGIYAVNQNLTVDGCFGKFPIQVQGLGIVGQCGDQQVIGFSNCPAGLMLKFVTNVQLFIILAWQ